MRKNTKAKKTSANSVTRQSQPLTRSRGLTEIIEILRYELRISFWQDMALSLVLFMLSVCITVASLFIK